MNYTMKLVLLAIILSFGSTSSAQNSAQYVCQITLSHSDTSGYFHVTGKVTNHSTNNIAAFWISLSFYGDNGDPIGSDSTIAEDRLNGIAPDHSIVWSKSWSPPEGYRVARVEANVTDVQFFDPNYGKH
jgi:hypothetical protein